MALNNKTILLSRTDSIGDVVLTLPMAGFIKKTDPSIRVLFLGRTYTKDVINLSIYVDGFINYDEIANLSIADQKATLRGFNVDFFVHVYPVRKIAQLAKLAKIKNRIGTTNRLFHWLTCNQLVKLSRRNSNLHEAQLNLKLLSFLSANTNLALENIPNLYGFEHFPSIKVEALQMLDSKRKKIILHPKSKGSAKEWGLPNFSALIAALPEQQYQVFISGTKDDAAQMDEFLKLHSKVINLCGKLNLAEFIVFIAHCDTLIAASTGPLHIAAALNKNSIGLFSPKRPIHPGRWAPLGAKAKCLVFDPLCQNCNKGLDCDCITKIAPSTVINNIE